MLSHKTLFIFDVDGTLVDAYPAIISSFNFTMQRLKYPKRSSAVIRRAVGWGDDRLLRPFVSRKDFKDALKVYRSHHKGALKKQVRWMPYAKSLLACLKKRKIKLAVASNRPTEFTLIILRRLGALVFFNKILCADKIAFKKPHPLILNKIVADLGIGKRESVYIGDMAIDVLTGKRAGIDTIAVATGSSSFKELKSARPAYFFKDLLTLKNNCLKVPMVNKREHFCSKGHKERK